MSKKILIVDDEEAVRNLLTAFLSAEGYETKTLENGQEAVDEFENGIRYDLVISDNDMPIMKGEMSIPLIKELQSDIKIILMSGDDNPPQNLPVDFFFQKPFSSVIAVVDKIQELLG